MAERLVFTGKGAVALESFTPCGPGVGEVRFKTHCSLMSTGTENIVLNRLFEPGTGWDAWVKYPFYPGYAAVGVVTEAPGEAGGLAVGDRVVCRRGHASEHVLPAGECFRIPDGIGDEEASWFALGKIAAMGARAADIKLGDRVVVVGAGPVGQMAVRWAAAAGAGMVICVDPFAERLALAGRGGAAHVIGRGISEAVAEIEKLTGGALADVVIDSTGHHAVLVESFKVAKRFGRVVLLGDTGTPSRQCLSHEVMRKGLTIVAAHDTHEVEGWDSARITGLLFSLALRGRFDLTGLVSHRFAAREYLDAYGVANRERNTTMGILLNWRRA